GGRSDVVAGDALGDAASQPGAVEPDPGADRGRPAALLTIHPSALRTDSCWPRAVVVGRRSSRGVARVPPARSSASKGTFMAAGCKQGHLIGTGRSTPRRPSGLRADRPGPAGISTGW